MYSDAVIILQHHQSNIDLFEVKQIQKVNKTQTTWDPPWRYCLRLDVSTLSDYIIHLHSENITY